MCVELQQMYLFDRILKNIYKSTYLLLIIKLMSTEQVQENPPSPDQPQKK